jgi:hypothetical protein
MSERDVADVSATGLKRAGFRRIEHCPTGCEFPVLTSHNIQC